MMLDGVGVTSPFHQLHCPDPAFLDPLWKTKSHLEADKSGAKSHLSGSTQTHWTTSSNTGDPLAVHVGVTAYIAVIECVPFVNDDSVKFALPPIRRWTRGLPCHP